MGLYLTQEQLDKRLSNSELRIVEKEPDPRLGSNRENLPREVKVLGGVLSKTGMTQSEAAEFLDITQTQVSIATRGLNGSTTGARFDETLKNEIQAAADKVNERNKPSLDKVKDAALDALTLAVTGVVDGLKNEPMAAKDMSKIAVDMSKVMDKLNPNRDSGQGTKVLIINNPGHKSEAHYEKVTA